MADAVKSSAMAGDRLQKVQSILEKKTKSLTVVYTKEGGLSVVLAAAREEEDTEQSSSVLTCHSAAMALDPSRRQNHCGYCASFIHDKRGFCERCGIISMCGGCEKILRDWHSSSGECLVLQALAKVVGHKALDACLLLTIRLMWRRWYDSQLCNSHTDNKDLKKMPLSPIDWELFDCLFCNVDTFGPNDDDNGVDSVSLLLNHLRQEITKMSKDTNVEWLSRKSFDDVLGRVQGCSHAITNVCLPLGEQCLGRALFLKHSFYNHDCMPNAFLSCHFETKKTSRCLPAITARLHLLRPLQKGEAVTISYIPMSGLDKKERQSRLSQGYNFECSCESCSSDSFQNHLKLPDDADIESLRQVQYTCNSQLIALDQRKGDAETEFQEGVDSCLGMLQMLQRGLDNQQIPPSHEVALERHRLLAKTHSLSGNFSCAVQEHESFFQALQPIEQLFDPVTRATQHLEYARVLHEDENKRQQQLSLALKSATLALGHDHAFVQLIHDELRTHEQTNKKQKRM